MTGQRRAGAASLAAAMSELQIIQSTLEQAAQRRRWARALRGLWYGLLVGAVLSLVLISVWHLVPLPLWTLTAAALVPLLCALGGMIVGGWHKTPLSEVARWVDGRQHLQERLSTALEFAGALRGLWYGLLVGAVLSLVLISLWHLVPLPLWTLTAAALVPLLCALGGMIVGGWHKTPTII